MKFKINLNINKGYKWYKENNIYCKGYLFDENNNFYEKKNLINYFKNIKSPEQFESIIKKSNGIFSIVINRDNKLFASVDHIRSFPLFYTQIENKFYLSDKPRWIRNNINEEKINNISRNEFLLTGYVTGNQTLYENIKQLRNGESIFIFNNKVSFSKENNYCSFKFEKTKDELKKELDSKLMKIFNRIIKKADGKKLIIPLSGGYDSRLIILMLKKLKYENILAFSYGKPGNKESEISKKIAEELGVDWKFIKYDNKKWYKWFRSEEWLKYCLMSDGLNTIPHLQDWPAVMKMKKNNSIPKDSIFIPGHTVTLQLEGKPDNKNNVINSIIKKHYSLWPISQLEKKTQVDIKNKISTIIDQLPQNKTSWHIDSFEFWENQERQSKFIINSVRVYEFWGYEWFLPLWDLELVEFWKHLPSKYKINKKIYKDYIDDLYMDITNKKRKLGVAENKTKKIIKGITKKLYIFPFVKKINEVVKSLRQYNKHPLGWYGILEKKDYRKNYNGKQHINSFLTKWYLENEIYKI